MASLENNEKLVSIDDLKSDFREFILDKKRMVKPRDAIRELWPFIYVLHKTGTRFPEIVRRLKDRGLDIKENTLRKYFYDDEKRFQSDPAIQKMVNLLFEEFRNDKAPIPVLTEIQSHPEQTTYHEPKTPREELVEDALTLDRIFNDSYLISLESTGSKTLEMKAAYEKHGEIWFLNEYGITELSRLKEKFPDLKAPPIREA